MARKIKFALEMADGAKVRGNIDELREHFDIESAVRYFLSGKLIEWLDDRYYESEAEALEQIDKDSPDFHQKLCEALGVEYKTDDDLDVAALERLNEKKAILRQMTDDEEILRNADKTALTQEDLADLLDMGETTIYLCGEKFNVPSRVKNKKYIGVLKKPSITIKANSKEELTEKGIVFENTTLPWMQSDTNNQPSVLEQNAVEANRTVSVDAKKIQEVFWTIFSKYRDKPFPIWETVSKSGKERKADFSDMQKQIALDVVFHGEYSENEILFIRMLSDLSAGIAFTTNSFCTGGTIGNNMILYQDIDAVSTDQLQFGEFKIFCGDKITEISEWTTPCKGLIGRYEKAEKLVDFLTVVKNLYGPKEGRPKMSGLMGMYYSSFSK